MFQFGEILTLSICAVAVVYLIAEWRRIRILPALRPFVGPFLLMIAGWIATVVEGLFLEGGQMHLLVFGEESMGIGRQTMLSELFNLAEHLSYMAAAVWLLLAVVGRLRAARETAA